MPNFGLQLQGISPVKEQGGSKSNSKKRGIKKSMTNVLGEGITNLIISKSKSTANNSNSLLYGKSV